MNSPALLTLTFAALLSAPAGAAPLPVILRSGQAHVTATALEKDAGIVIKRLPGGSEFAACSTEQCAPLNGVLTDGATLLVPVAGLSAALHLNATFDAGRAQVEFVPAPGEAPGSTGAARLGGMVLNLRLTKLDGTPVSLDEFRGRRVLINSWASW